MKIRSILQLDELLDAELQWRKHELINLNNLHRRARSHQQELLRRAGVALLYAHWEGFIKAAGTAYVEFVSRQRLKQSELTTGLLAIAARGAIGDFGATRRAELLMKVVRFFRDEQQNLAQFDIRGAVQTKSNISAERIRDIIALLDFDYAPFEVHEKSIIESLVKERNQIAHGQHLTVDANRYDELHNGVLTLLDEFARQIRNAAFSKGYRRTPGLVEE